MTERNGKRLFVGPGETQAYVRRMTASALTHLDTIEERIVATLKVEAVEPERYRRKVNNIVVVICAIRREVAEIHRSAYVRGSQSPLREEAIPGPGPSCTLAETVPQTAGGVESGRA